MKLRLTKLGACIFALSLVACLLLPGFAVGEAGGFWSTTIEEAILDGDKVTEDIIVPSDAASWLLTQDAAITGERKSDGTFPWILPESQSAWMIAGVDNKLTLRNINFQDIGLRINELEIGGKIEGRRTGAPLPELSGQNWKSMARALKTTIGGTFTMSQSPLSDEKITEAHEQGSALTLDTDQIFMDKNSKLLLQYEGRNLCLHECLDHDPEDCTHSCSAEGFKCSANVLLGGYDLDMPEFDATGGADKENFKATIMYWNGENDVAKVFYGIDSLNEAIQDGALNGAVSLLVEYVVPEEEDEEEEETLDVNGSVVWVDEGFESYRPESAVQVQLMQNGKSYGKPVQVKDGAFSFKDVPKADADGKEYAYTVAALDPDDELFSYDITYETRNVIKLTIVTFEATTRHIAVLEPSGELEEFGAETAYVPRGYSYTVYALDEEELVDYLRFAGTDDEKSYTFADIAEDSEHSFYYNIIITTTDVSGAVVWADEGYEDYRPVSAVQVQLMQNGAACGAPIQVANGAFSFEDMPVLDGDSKPYAYTVTALDPNNELFSYDIAYKPGNVIELTIVTFEAKVNHVMLTLVPERDPVEEIFVTSTMRVPRGYSHTVHALEGEALPDHMQFSGTDAEKSYTFADMSADGEHSFYYNIIETVTDVTGAVVWMDEGYESYRPESAVQVQLLQDGAPYGDSIHVKDGAFSFEDMPVLDEEGKPYAYTVAAFDPNGELFSYDIAYKPRNVIELTIVTFEAKVNHVMLTPVPDSDPEEDVFETSFERVPRGHAPQNATVKALEGSDLRDDLEFTGAPGEETYTFAALSADALHSFYYNRKTIDIEGIVKFANEDEYWYWSEEDIHPENVVIKLYQNDMNTQIDNLTLEVPSTWLNYDSTWIKYEEDAMGGLNPEIPFEFTDLFMADKDGRPCVYGVAQDGTGLPWYSTQNPGFGSGSYVITNTLQFVQVTWEYIDRQSEDLISGGSSHCIKGWPLDIWVREKIEGSNWNEKYVYSGNEPLEGGFYVKPQLEDITITFIYDLYREIQWRHEWVDSGIQDGRQPFTASLLQNGAPLKAYTVTTGDAEWDGEWVPVYDDSGIDYVYTLVALGTAVPKYVHEVGGNPLNLTSTRIYDIVVEKEYLTPVPTSGIMAREEYLDTVQTPGEGTETSTRTRAAMGILPTAESLIQTFPTRHGDRFEYMAEDGEEDWFMWFEIDDEIFETNPWVIDPVTRDWYIKAVYGMN